MGARPLAKEKGEPLANFLNLWVTPMLGLAEVGLLLVAVYLTIVQFTRSRASSYIERFNSGDMFDSRVAVDRWLATHATSKARLEALAQDPALHTQLRRFANLFQELGAAYQFRVADRKTVRVLFDALVVMYWERLRFWIRDYRARADPTLYARFEYLYGEMRSGQQDPGARPQYVLAYGSLMDPASLSAALGREVLDDELVPATLSGWRREWSVGERVHLEDSGEAATAAFLDVTPAGGSSVSAALVEVSGAELDRLALREKSYVARDVRDDVRLAGDFPVSDQAVVWCFVGKPRFRVEAGRNDAVLLGHYLERVGRASRSVDPGLESQIRASAESSGFPIVDSAYTFVDTEQAGLV